MQLISMHSLLASYVQGRRTVARKAEVLRLEDLVCRRVVQDGLSVNTSLMSESALPTVLADKSEPDKRDEVSRTNPVMGLLNGTLICTVAVSCSASSRLARQGSHTGVGHEVLKVLELAEVVPVAGQQAQKGADFS